MKKILVECHHALGDVVMTLPALNNLRTKYPDAQIDYMCGLKNEVPLLEHISLVDRVYVYNVKENSGLDLLKLALRLRIENYDMGVSFGGSPSGFDILFLKLSGCREIVAAEEPRAIYKRYRQVQVPKQLHRVERAMRIVETITGDGTLQTVTLQVDIHMVQQLQSRYNIRSDDRLIGLVIGTGNFMYRDGKRIVQYNTKQWELHNFIELSRKLVHMGYRVMLIGGEKERADVLQQHVKFEPGVICTLGELSILESVAAMTLCELVVGADTGPMHCAAAAGVTTLTLFGSTDPGLIAPYGENAYTLESNHACRRCYSENNEKGRNCRPAKCMQAIMVENVYEKILEINA